MVERIGEIELEKLVVGQMEVNCYLIGCKSTKKAVIIDPGGDGVRIMNRIKKHAMDPICIINTHGHGDHIGANGMFNLPVLIHRLDSEFLTDPARNLSSFFGCPFTSPAPSRLLEDGERIHIGEVVLEVIHTPGHTPGGISLRSDSVILTGDTLFAGGIGRTDFPYGSEERLLRSIKERLMIFPDDTVIYPGHGPQSTIGEERRRNPFLS